MTSHHAAKDRDRALRIARAIAPEGFIIGASIVNGRVWLSFDEAPFPAILPSCIFPSGYGYSFAAGREELTYPPSVAAVIRRICEALVAAGIKGTDVSISHAVGKRHVAQIIALSHSAHGRMRLAGLLAATGLDEAAISKQLVTLCQTK